jgi:hypothetical protein
LLRLLPSPTANSTDALRIDGVGDLLRAAFGFVRAWDEHRTAALSAGEEPQEIRDLRASVGGQVRALLTSHVKTTHEGSALADLLPIAAEVLHGSSAAWAEWFPALWDRLVEGWPDVVEFSRNNLWAVGRMMHFLAAVVERNPDSKAIVAREKVLEALPLSATNLTGLVGILNKELWDNVTWQKLMHQIRVGAGGARGKFPGSWRSTVCDIVRLTVLRSHKPLPEELRFLVSTVIDLAAHEDALVANHAAYAVAAVARYGIDPADTKLAEEIAEALHWIGDDTRPSVRAAAAYAAGGLQQSATHAPLKHLSDELAASFAEDCYARVRYEWLYGERQAKAEMVSGGAPGDSNAPASP